MMRSGRSPPNPSWARSSLRCAVYYDGVDGSISTFGGLIMTVEKGG